MFIVILTHSPFASDMLARVHGGTDVYILEGVQANETMYASPKEYLRGTVRRMVCERENWSVQSGCGCQIHLRGTPECLFVHVVSGVHNGPGARAGLGGSAVLEEEGVDIR